MYLASFQCSSTWASARGGFGASLAATTCAKYDVETAAYLPTPGASRHFSSSNSFFLKSLGSKSLAEWRSVFSFVARTTSVANSPCRWKKFLAFSQMAAAPVASVDAGCSPAISLRVRHADCEIARRCFFGVSPRFSTVSVIPSSNGPPVALIALVSSSSRPGS